MTNSEWKLGSVLGEQKGMLWTVENKKPSALPERAAST
jgi:hypothetical protein